MTLTRTIIRSTTLVDVRTGDLQPGMDVTIEGGRITALARTEEVRSDTTARIIEAQGTYIVPGFCDMHAHPLDRKNPEPALRLMLTTGVTSFRQMSGSRKLLESRAAGHLLLPADGAAPVGMPGEILWGLNAGTEEAAVHTVRKQIDQGADFIKIAMIDSPVFFAAQAEAARLGVDVVGHLPADIDVRAASDGRMHSIEHIGLPGVAVLAACCDHEADVQQAAARRGNLALPPIGSIPFAERLLGGLMTRMTNRIIINPLLLTKPADAELIAEADQTFNLDKARSLARTFASDGTWQCPTLIRLRTQQFFDDPMYEEQPENRYASPQSLRRWRKAARRYGSRPQMLRTAFQDVYARQLTMVRIFDEEGVSMLAGSDVSGAGWEIPGFALHREFEQLAAAGLTPLRILQMATINAAEFLGRTATMGTVEPGKDADLVLLAQNPLTSVSNLHQIVGVVRAGQHFSAEALERIAQTAATERAAV